MPEWHEAGSIKIENPKELKSKLIREGEAKAFYKYYHSAVFSNQESISWTKMLVGGDDNKLAAGAVLAKQMRSSNSIACLILTRNSGTNTGLNYFISSFEIVPVMTNTGSTENEEMGKIYQDYPRFYWSDYYSNKEYYIALIEKRY